MATEKQIQYAASLKDKVQSLIAAKTADLDKMAQDERSNPKLVTNRRAKVAKVQDLLKIEDTEHLIQALKLSDWDSLVVAGDLYAEGGLRALYHA